MTSQTPSQTPAAQSKHATAPRNPTSPGGAGYTPHKRWTTRWAILLLIALQPWLLMHLSRYHFGNSLPLNPVVRTFPTVDESYEYYEFFDRTMRPYTALQIIHPQMSLPGYLRAPQLNDFERDAIKLFVDDYLTFHIANRNKAGTRYLLFRPQRAGIGDRTGVLLYSYWLAVMSKRVLLIDWVNPFPLQEFITNARAGANFFYHNRTDRARGIVMGLDPFDNTSKVIVMNGTEMDYAWDEKMMMSGAPVVVSHFNRMQRSFSDAFVKFAKPAHISISDMLNIRANANFHRVVFHRVFRLSNELIRDHMLLSHRLHLRAPYMAREVARFARNLSDSLPAATRAWSATSALNMTSYTPYIGVHARIGKGVGEGRERFEQITLHMTKAAKCLASRAIRLSHMAGEPDLPIFLATDTAEFRKLFQTVVGKMGHKRIRVLSGDWDIVHSTRMAATGRGNVKPTDAGVRRVMWGSYMDLIMLGHAQHVLALYSSFPRLAVRLGDSETLTELRNDICLKNDHWT